MAPRPHFRDLLAEPGCLVVPVIYDALSARIAERVGFRAIGLGGLLAAASRLGDPDVGQLTMTELTDHLRGITAAVAIPVMADAGAGHGNPLNVCPTVETYKAAGGQAIVLEDQVWPKKCGHIPGPRQVIPTAEHRRKIEAAVEARRDPRTVIIARTDARGPLGFDEAIRRARAYVDAGADGIFLEALQTSEEFREAPRALPGVPLVANRRPHVHHGQVAAVHHPGARRDGVQGRPLGGGRAVAGRPGGRGRADRPPPRTAPPPPCATAS